MKYLKGNEIRQMWIDFFKSKDHNVERGASLIPNDDPTLLWMNSGVAALKKYFDGSVIPKNPRIVNAQKCIRTNDIENVGKTARHHTFFEMLGNFSIGDYFRKEAVTWGYELLTDPKWFGFDKDLLYVTIYPTDMETKALWMGLGIAESHIIPTDDDNFWEIGEGPCGPCTEIYVDRGPRFGDFTPTRSKTARPTTAISKFGTSYSANTTRSPGYRAANTPNFPTRTSIPDPVWNGLPRSYKKPTPTLRPTCSSPSSNTSKPSAKCHIPAKWHSKSSPTTFGPYRSPSPTAPCFPMKVVGMSFAACSEEP
jgi:hypothetical protein